MTGNARRRPRPSEGDRVSALCSECCACLAHSSPSRPERVQRVDFEARHISSIARATARFSCCVKKKRNMKSRSHSHSESLLQRPANLRWLQFHPYFEFHIHLTSPTCPCADWNENLPAPCRPRRGDVDSSDASAGEERAAGGPGGRRRRGGRNHFSFPRPSFKFPPPPLALGRSFTRQVSFDQLLDSVPVYRARREERDEFGEKREEGE